MLYLQIKEEIKTAMKNKDTEKRDVLKMVVDKAKAIVKEKNPTNVTEDIPDDVILQAIQKEVKQLNQTKDALKGKENTDLYASTTLKIGILSEYLPTQMTENELEKYIESELIELTGVNVEISPKIKGMVMKNIMPKLKGKADSRLINKVVDRLLNN
nr:MAG TPA: YqeY-like protein [Caudoviricetes sp.]